MDFLMDSERGSDLRSDLRHCVNNSKFSDVTFICRDGERKHAFRAILAIRSDMFNSMFFGQMRESNMAEVNLPSISAAQLQIVLEYCYTDETPSLTLENAVEVFQAAEYFLLPRLQVFIVEFVRDNLNDHAMAGRILSEAADILDQCPSDEALYSVVRDFILAEPLQYGQLYPVSKDAMAVLLSDADAVRECPTYAFDFFLCIIDWACEMIGDTHLGIARRDLIVILSSLQATEAMLPTSPAPILPPDTLKQLETFLSPIIRCMNFQDICQHRLVTLMDTLTFIPPTIFAEAFRRHVAIRTVCPPSWRHRTGCLWDPEHKGPQLKLSANNSVVEFDETQPNRHQSVTSAAPMTGKGIYEWDVIIQAFNSAHSRVAVGLASKSISSHENALLGKQVNSWGLASTGKVYCPYAETVFVGGYAKDSVISFRVDMAERCCSITVNGTDKGVIWRNLPDNIYPACSLTLGSKCEIRQKS